MRVRDLLAHRTKKLISVDPNTEVGDAVPLLFSHNIAGLPVLGPDGAAVGFVSERDIVASVFGNLGPVRHLRVRDIMRPAPLCDADDSVEHVMRVMTTDHLRHLVVRDKGKVIGIVSVGDMVKYRLGDLETETAVLRDYVAAHRAAR